jgi:MerR family transcriptional regulator, copper efflux regulator
MLIKELAEKTGLTPQTIRFYEKEGFLDQHYIRRRENNYRDYSEDAVKQLLQLKAGQAAGFTLAELKQYREAVEAGEVATQQQVTFLHQKIDDINGKVAELERMRAHLMTLIQMNKVGSFCIRMHGKSHAPMATEQN